jgi:hypothetical protein
MPLFVSQVPDKAFGDKHVLTAQAMDALPVQGEQSGVDAVAQDVEDVFHPDLAVGRQASQAGVSDEDRAGAEGVG